MSSLLNSGLAAARRHGNCSRDVLGVAYFDLSSQCSHAHGYVRRGAGEFVECRCGRCLQDAAAALEIELRERRARAAK